jgi:PAS domain S-box-containing protein
MTDAAALIHSIVVVRAVLMGAAGLAAGLVIPWRMCAAWVAGGVAIEAWSWYATRRQARGEAVALRDQAGFAANYIVLNLWWILLAICLWRSGTPEGPASGGILLACIAATIALLLHTAPAMFVVSAVAPGIAGLAMILLADGRGWREALPIWLMLGLASLFSLGRAIGAPSMQKQQRWLSDSLRSYEILAENIADVIVRFDLDGVCQYASPASLAALGRTPADLIGAPLSSLLHPRSAAVMASVLRKMLATDAPSQTVTVRARHADGRWLSFQTGLKMVREAGVAVAVIGVSRDVTERLAVEIALREAKTEAEAANLAKAEFLANVSHEIRTPMNGILGALHLLDREGISPEGRSLMRQADDCGRMLSQLLNDVLDFSKIEAGHLDLDPAPMDVSEAVRAVTALLGDQARGKGLELVCEIEAEDPWIVADPLRLRQIMFNLVGNAVKFTEDGRVTCRLGVQPGDDGARRIRLEVTDTGIGIEPQLQRHLFERFRQAESATTRRFGGTGLGLSITRALVQMMGGEIGFSSVAGKGSSFWVCFEAPAAAPASGRVIEDGLLEGLRILLVDDNATNRLVARTILTRLGADVAEAANGRDALEAARMGVHDLILMDVQMPVMDGLDATRAIRALGGDVGATPILGLTANAMAHQRVRYLAAGMNGVVAKPISPASLLGEIARLTAPADLEHARLTAAP